MAETGKWMHCEPRGTTHDWYECSACGLNKLFPVGEIPDGHDCLRDLYWWVGEESRINAGLTLYKAMLRIHPELALKGFDGGWKPPCKRCGGKHTVHGIGGQPSLCPVCKGYSDSDMVP